MRRTLSAAVVAATLVAVQGAMPAAFAATTTVAPVTDVHVTPGVTTGGGVKVSLTWATPPGVAGTRVCERSGTVADTDPTACTRYVDAPVAGGGPPLPAVGKNKPYVFTLFAYDDSRNYSSGVSRALDGTTLSLTGVKKIRYGHGLTLGTSLHDVPSGAALDGKTVTLWAIGTPAGSTWHKVATRTTGANGAATAHVTPKANTGYQWRYRGVKDALMATTSAAKLVHVAYVVTAKLTRSSIPVGKTFRIYGVVRPAHAGALVYLQRRVNGVWHTTTTRVRQALQTLPDGRHVVGYVFTLKATQRGTFRMRVLRPATILHAAGRSPAVTLVVS